MSRYRYDIYSRSNLPYVGNAGTKLVEITDQIYLAGTGWRQEYNGTGSGQIVINRHHAACTSANFADGNYVLVVDTVLAKNIAGFFLPRGTVRLLSYDEAGDENLTIQGQGSLSYLGRAVWWNQSYVAAGTYRDIDPRPDGQWYWQGISTVGPGGPSGEQYGDILHRAIDEAQSNPNNPLPAVTMSFGHINDSASNPWDSWLGIYRVPIGRNYIDFLIDVIRLGLTVQMNPLFRLDAYQGDHGTDRSSATFASGKVRFAGGTNIPADLDRSLQPNARVKRLLVRGQSSDPDDMVELTDSSAPWESQGFIEDGAIDNADQLAALGANEIALRGAQSDIARFPILLGDTPLSGVYVPSWPGDGGHFWLGDTITIHTGTGALDYNEEPLRIAAISSTIDDAANDIVEVELGTTFTDFSKPGIAGTTAPGGGSGCSCLYLCSGSGCVDPFDRVEASGGGTGPLGPWVGGGFLSVDGNMADLGNAPANSDWLELPLGAGPIEVLVDFFPLDTSDNGWYVRISAYDPDTTWESLIQVNGDAGFGTTYTNVADDRPGLNIDFDDDTFGNPHHDVAMRGRMLIDERGIYGRFWRTADPEPVTTAPLTPPIGGRGEKWTCYSVSQDALRTPANFQRLIIGGGSGSTGTPLIDRVELVTPCSGESFDIADVGATGESGAAAHCDHVHAHGLLNTGTYHNAAGITFTPGAIDATNVQEAIEEVSPFEPGTLASAWRLRDPAFTTLHDNSETAYLYLDATLASIGVGNLEFLYADSSTGKAYIGATNGLVIPIISADPAGGDSEKGQLYYNDVSDTVRWYDGAAWADFGAGGGSHTHVYSETPSGTINGSNAAFTIAATPVAGTLRLYKNGLRQRAGAGNDYTLATATITYESGNVPQTGDSHVADYES